MKFAMVLLLGMSAWAQSNSVRKCPEGYSTFKELNDDGKPSGWVRCAILPTEEQMKAQTQTLPTPLILPGTKTLPIPSEPVSEFKNGPGWWIYYDERTGHLVCSVSGRRAHCAITRTKDGWLVQPPKLHGRKMEKAPLPKE